MLQKVPGLSKGDERSILRELRTYNTKRLFQEARAHREAARHFAMEGRGRAANENHKISNIFYQRAYGKKKQSAYLNRKRR